MTAPPTEAMSDDAPGPVARRSLRAVLAVQTQNAFNDNVVRYALLGVALMILEKGTWVFDYYKNIIAGLISLPFVLFAPIAGWISDRYPKSQVIRTCLYFQIGIIGLIIVAMLMKNLWFATAGFFILAVQSAFFGPAKFGIIKELVGSRQLSRAAGLMQMLTILAIVVGAVAGGEGLKQAVAHVSTDPWVAGLIPVGMVGLGAFFALWVIRGLSETPSHPVEPLSIRTFFGHFTDLGEIFRHRFLTLSCIGIAYFWFSGAFAMATFTQVAQEHYDGATAAAFASYYLATTSLGIAAGSVFVAFVSGNRFELGLVPVGGLGLAMSLLLCAICPVQSAWFYLGLFLLGATSAIFLVPQNAFLQDRADPKRRGRILAASNMLNSAASLSASLALQPFCQAIGMSSKAQFLVVGILSLAVGLYALKLLPSQFVRIPFKFLLRLLYRIRMSGDHHLPSEGGALLLANHVTWIDGLLLSAASPRDIRFVAHDNFFKKGIVAWGLRLFNVVPISSKNARQAIKTTAAEVNAGGVVCLFPEGTLTRTGTMNELQKGFELIARQLDGAPVIPVHLDRLWGSIFSYANGKFFRKRPRHIPYDVSIRFGEPLPPKEAKHATVQRALAELGRDAYQGRPELYQSLGHACIARLKRGGRKPCIITKGSDRHSVLNRRTVLTTGLLLGKRWRASIADERVGVVLPPSSSSLLAHLGLALAGKQIVPLPLQPCPEEITRIQQLGLRTVITTKGVHSGLATFPWPDDVITLTEELRALNGLPRILAYLTARWGCAKWLQRRYLPNKDPDSIAVHFIDGRAPLTHRQILTQAAQIADVHLLHEGDNLLVLYGSEHPMGQHFGIWLPLMHRQVALVPAMSATPTTPEVLLRAEDLRLVVADAETLKAFENARSDVYRLTADAPLQDDHLYHTHLAPCQSVLTTLTYPDVHFHDLIQPGHRPGTYGKSLPGTCLIEENGEVRAEHPATTAFTFPGQLDSEGFLAPPTHDA